MFVVALVPCCKIHINKFTVLCYSYAFQRNIDHATTVLSLVGAWARVCLSVCLCACMILCKGVCVYVCLSIHVSGVCVSVFMCLYGSLQRCVCASVCLHVSVWFSAEVCVCV